MGMLESGGELLTRIVPDVRRVSLRPQICENILPGSILHTDEAGAYRSICIRGYRHETCNHKQDEYVGRNGATVNTLEGFWNILKRGISGTHIHVSAKHLSKYLGEFEFRWNMRDVPHLMLDRLMFSFTR